MKIKLSILLITFVLFNFFAAKSEASCGLDDFFKSSSLTLAQVSFQKKNQRLYFYQESKNCPSGMCPGKAFVVPGDLVLSVPSLGVDWACSIYVSQKGVSTVGWLAKSSLKEETHSKAQISLLQGQWLYLSATSQNTLQIQSDAHQQLKLEATLLWFANQEALKSGAFHDGGFTTKISSELEWKYQGEGALASSTCEVEGRWIYPYLLVKDNKNCGALNVTAQGIYRKASSI